MKVLSFFWHNVLPDSTPLHGRDTTEPTVSVFREQIRFLVTRYTPVSLFDFLDMVNTPKLVGTYKNPPILLGFDDGFSYVLKHALPILKEFNIPATIFVLGKVVEDPDFVPWYLEVKHALRKTQKTEVVYADTALNLERMEDRLKFRKLFAASFMKPMPQVDRRQALKNVAHLLEVNHPVRSELDQDFQFVSEKDLRQIEKASLLTVASHAMTHIPLDTLSYTEQIEELENSHSVLEKACPNYIPIIAYPHGSFNQDSTAIAKRIYQAGFAVSQGASYDNLFAYPRSGLSNGSAKELSYQLSPIRLKFLLPFKYMLQRTGVLKGR